MDQSIKSPYIAQSKIPVESPEGIEIGGKILSIRLCVAPRWKIAVRYMSYLCTGFIMYLLNLWIPSLFVAMSLSNSDIEKATKVLVYGADNSVEIVPLREERTSSRALKVFHYRLIKYFYDGNDQTFKPCRFKVETLTLNKIHEKYGRGPSETVLTENAVFFGKNLTDIPKKSWLKLLIDEVLSPLYAFQVYSFAVWCNDDYWIYAVIIFAFSMISILITLYETIKTHNKLRSMSYYEIPINVYRKVEGESVRITINSSELVPGDVIEIPEAALMPCDAIILNGSCIMNESILTGESIPVVKNALPYNDSLYNLKEDKYHTVYAGTKCIQIRYFQEKAVLALVIATGFTTVKGELIRTMMYPKPTDFRFYSDAFKFVAILAVIALAGFLIDLPAWLEQNTDPVLSIVIIKASEIITVTVPPALPTCIQIGISLALVRLKKKSINCIAPTKINEAGRVNVMCFDKTGTLTEEGLELLGVRSVFFDKNLQKLRFSKIVKDVPALKQYIDEETREKDLEDYILLESIPGKPSVYKVTRMFPSEQILEIMASCHSLTMVQGQLIGDPLDLKMFKSTEWILEENNLEKYDALVKAVVKPPVIFAEGLPETENRNSLSIDQTEIGIIRRFEFSSKLQRMSVIVKNLQETGFKIHVKGSPEKIRELCRPETIPQNFHRTLEKYTERGYRVLACATRSLGSNYRRIMAANREDVEKEFTFVGFIMMENRLKSVTTGVINLLHSAEIKTVMVTGDNALTAISVARQCNIVEPNQRIFLGDLSEQKVDGKYVIEWKDFDFSERVLNNNLEPEFENQSQLIDSPSVCLSKSEILNNNIAIEEEVAVSKGSEKNEVRLSLRETLLPQSKMQSRKNTNIEAAKTPKRRFISTGEVNEFGIPFFNLSEHGNYCIAVTGRVFSMIVHEAEVNKEPEYQYMLQKLLRRCFVFARMLPDEKAALVKYMMSVPKAVVGMCGDGANDVSALKTANVGISLSQAEASIAAPFTSNVQDISCVPALLIEGRSALSTSYQEFKFVALYSIIQFAGVTMLYSQLMDFTNWQYYHVDILIVLSLSATMAMTEADNNLTKQMPTGRLMSVFVLTSVIGQMIIQVAFQVGTYLLLTQESWYDPSDCSDNFDSGDACSENTTLYIVSNYQYCMVAIVFMVGRPFKRPFYTNVWFTTSFFTLMVLNMFVTYNPFDFQFLYDQDDWAAEVPFESNWKNILMSIVLVNSLVTIVWEKVIVNYLTNTWKKYRESRLKKLEALKSFYVPPSTSVVNPMKSS